MAIFQTLRKWFGAGGATAQQEGVQTFEPLTRVYKTATPNYGLDGALQISAVWAAVELLSDNVASLPLFVYRKRSDGQKELARDEALYTLLHDSPNRRHTPMEFWQFMLMNFLLRGNAYARLVRSEGGEVIEMWPLSADQVTVEVMPDSSLVYKYVYDGKEAVYSESSILHIRDKGNGIIGMSRLEYMRSTLNVAVTAQDQTARVFAGNGKRPGVFMIDKLLTPAQRTAIRENYKGLTEGTETDLLVLEAGAKFEPLSMSPADVQLLDTRRFSVEDIARWFGISSVLINDTAKTTTWGTGIEQLIEGFYKFKLRPMLVQFEQAIQARVLTPAQRAVFKVEYSLDALLRSSYEKRVTVGKEAASAGLITINEWRQYENLAPVAGGDVPIAQINMAPLSMLGKVKATPEQKSDSFEYKSREYAAPTFNIHIPENITHVKTHEIKAPDVHVTVPAPVVTVKAPDITVNAPEVTVNPTPVEVKVDAPDLSAISAAIASGQTAQIEAIDNVRRAVEKPVKAVFDVNGKPVGSIKVDDL